MATKKTTQLMVPSQRIERRIYLVRGQKVMLDSDLAEPYQVPTKRLNEAVRRNAGRFPVDFMFQLTEEEAESLRSQIATSKVGRGGRRYLQNAFTEHGIVMLSSVLASERAIQMNIAIVRAFVKLREIMATHKELAKKIEALEGKYDRHDKELAAVFKAIKLLMEPPKESRTKARFGFREQ